MKSPDSIKKWQVYLADLGRPYGAEPGKKRPVVVVQTNLLNDTGYPSTIVCPVTSKVNSQLAIVRTHLKKNEAGLEKPSDILVDQLRTVDNRRLGECLGILRQESRMQLQNSLRILLDL